MRQMYYFFGQKYKKYPLDVRLVHYGAVDSQFKDFH